MAYLMAKLLKREKPLFNCRHTARLSQRPVACRLRLQLLGKRSQETE